MDNEEIKSVLQSMGAKVPPFSRLILLGGGALALLGNARATADIDFWGDDLRPDPLHELILKIAQELQIHVEAVPLEKFIPLPQARKRAASVSGNLATLKSTSRTPTASP